MKAIMGCLVLGTCLVAYGSEGPTYLGSLKGLVLAGMFQRGTFSFSPGVISDCKRDEVADMVVYHCKATDAELNMAGQNSVSGKIKLESANIYSRRTETGNLSRRYFFKGKYTETTGSAPFESEADLTFWTLRSQPSDITGQVKLERFDISAGLVAQ
jgi:hypothetical protein